jgi:hypothetical protein
MTHLLNIYFYSIEESVYIDKRHFRMDNKKFFIFPYYEVTPESIMIFYNEELSEVKYFFISKRKICKSVPSMSDNFIFFTIL